MSPLPTSPIGGERKKEFDVIINLFESSLSRGREISNDFYNKAKLLHDFQLQCDVEKNEAIPKEPDGLITLLNQILVKMESLNRRNAEILKHLDTII